MLQGTLMEYPWGEADSTKQQKRQLGAMLPAIVGCTWGKGTKYGLDATSKAHKWGKRPCHRVAETGKKEKGSQEATTNGPPPPDLWVAGHCMKTKIFQ